MLMGAEALGGIAVYSQSPRQWSEDEIRLLSLLANQTAIAIENTRLFKAEHTIRKRAEALHLQTIKQAQDITLAYDATIEGWSHALDLRDKETEEHTLRVTNLTLQLAQAIGVSDSALIHIQRGALLHDIGKMGIPDTILRKSGALSDDEWAMMRQHPQLAYEMLSPIVYLLPALDIPYCHHEKWDGTGYPRGLKGEEIPLAARIFAIVDVFDALTSDRPYRPAWTTKEAVVYIHEQAGIHFDPQVVNAFLRLIGDK
jgi:putative nucleotidyltransferase with HDIG domain